MHNGYLYMEHSLIYTWNTVSFIHGTQSYLYMEHNPIEQHRIKDFPPPAKVQKQELTGQNSQNICSHTISVPTWGDFLWSCKHTVTVICCERVKSLLTLTFDLIFCDKKLKTSIIKLGWTELEGKEHDPGLYIKTECLCRI